MCYLDFDWNPCFELSTPFGLKKQLSRWRRARTSACGSSTRPAASSGRGEKKSSFSRRTLRWHELPYACPTMMNWWSLVEYESFDKVSEYINRNVKMSCRFLQNSVDVGKIPTSSARKPRNLKESVELPKHAWQFRENSRATNWRNLKFSLDQIAEFEKI